MRHTLALIALISSAPFAGTAMAAEPLHLTPPLYREQARTVQQARLAGALTTTPQPVAAVKPVDARRVVEVVAEAMPTR